MSFISFASFRRVSAGRAGVRQQGHLPRVLDGLGDLALLLHGDAGDTPGSDLATIGDELAQDVDVLVVDLLDTRGLQRVLLLLGLTDRRLRHRGAPREGSPGVAPGWAGAGREGRPGGSVLLGGSGGATASRGGGHQKGGASGAPAEGVPPPPPDGP